MAKAQSPKKLAAELAHCIHDTGGIDAQETAYGLFLKRWSLDERIELLRCGDGQFIERINAILEQTDLEQTFSVYLDEGKDPAIYFYEEFIRACDPANAHGRGVHYSPPSVVSYMTRGVESILQSEFGLSLPEAVVVDPCCGTGTFLKHIENHCQHGRLIGLELMETPAALASCILKKSDIRLIDSLGDIDLSIGDMPLVIIGNPPYSGHSANSGKIKHLLADYKNGLKERNSKWLQDDYVKFIRMAQHHVETAGKGIIAFITNHSFLFNPTFRVMRESLMHSFDQIYILDLHGNAKINSQPLDENVFPIQMGVAISFMVRTDTPQCKHPELSRRMHRLCYAQLRGTRKEKLDTLAIMDFSETPWAGITSAKPFYSFVPINNKLQEEYYSFPSIIDLFERSSVGFVTSRDAFAVDADKNALIERIAALRDNSITPDEIRTRYAVGDLDIDSARRILLDDPNWREKMVEVAYRPFEKRWAYLSRAVMERPRLPFMESMLHDNIALAIGRAGQVTGSREWDVVFCTDCPADLNLFRRGGAMLFPRYIYTHGHRFSNLKPNRDNLFYYIYAILHSTEYRQRYADFLKSDYPRIPLIDDVNVYKSLASLGEELIAIHLMPNTAISSEPSQMTIGGYSIPYGSAVTQTIAIREQIDNIYKYKLNALCELN